MRAPSDVISGSPSFHSKVEQQADGSYVATNVSMTQIKPQVGATASIATEKLNRATEEWIGNGCQ